MSLIELVELIKANGLTSTLLIVLATLTVIQISPLKIDPWGFIHKNVVKFLNGEVLEKISDLDDRVAKIQEEVVLNEMRRAKSEAVGARIRILRFNDELLHNQAHSKAMFDQILLDIDHYNEYCEKDTHFRNGVTMLASENIRKVYAKCSEEHKFLD